MRRIPFVIAIFLLVISVGNMRAQCIPDSSTNALFSPNFSTGLPDGRVGMEYYTVMTLNVPPDTTYLTLTAVIDSMVLTEVTGLPPGFSYECNPPSCGFAGGSSGCIAVLGITHDPDHAKEWNIEADFQFYLKQPPVTLPYAITGYSIRLDSAFATGKEEFKEADYRFHIEPNPISAASQLVFDLPQAERYSLDIYSLLGTNVAHMERNGRVGKNSFLLGDYATEAGVYFISIHQGPYTRSLRFIVQ
ncbi:MAG: T9SS type A sorting domain-containing protein [Cryomorphaceae bacterium]